MSESLNTPVVLLVIVPLAGAAVALFEKVFPKLNLSRFVALACVCVGVVTLVFLYGSIEGGVEVRYVLGGWSEPYGITLYLDGLSWLGSVVIYAVAFPVLLYGVGRRSYKPSFYFYFLVMIGAMEGVILSGDIFNIFVFFEILALSSCVLVAYEKKPHSVVASFKYLMISSLGISFFLIGIFIIYQLTGTLSVREVGAHLHLLCADGADPGVRIAGTIAVLCMVTGIGVRIAFVPFHFWLPEAHAFAPHPVSAMLSGVLIKIGFIVLWRLATLFSAVDIGEFLIVSGAVTAALGVCWALVQTDAKRLLAFHSVSQMGYIISVFGAGTMVSMTASFYHVVNHALFKSLLFLSVGMVIVYTGKRDVFKLRGLGGELPLVAIPFAVGALSIAGVFPFNGYASKALISYSLRPHWIYPLIWFTGAGTVASFLKLSQVFIGSKGKNESSYGPRDVEEPTSDVPKQTEKPSSRGTKCPKLQYAALWLLAAACLITGIMPGFFGGHIASLIGASGVGGSPAGISILHSAGGGDGFMLPNVFQLRMLLESLIPVAVGFLVYMGVMSGKGKVFARIIRERSIGLEGAMVFLLVGFLILSVYAVFYPLIWAV